MVYGQVKKVCEIESYKEGSECLLPSKKEFLHVRIEIRGPVLDDPGTIFYYFYVFIFFIEIWSLHFTLFCTY